MLRRPWVVCSSARRFGAAFVLVRASSRSFTGWVVVAAFRSSLVASRFADFWSGVSGFCSVRFLPSGLWGVSVPVFR